MVMPAGEAGAGVRAEPEPASTTFVRRGLRVDVAAVRGSAAERTLVELRTRHYRAVLDGLGVPVWDGYDAEALHFVCSVAGTPVAAMRSTWDDLGGGEAVHDFPDLAERLPDRVTDFLYLSRQLVVPDLRRLGLPAVLAYAAATWWWSAQPRPGYALAAGRASTLGTARGLGGSLLAGPARIGPARTPIFLLGAPVAVLAGHAGHLLNRLGWAAGGLHH